MCEFLFGLQGVMCFGARSVNGLTIEIYDLSGRAVRRWTNDRAVGSFSEAWDGTDDEDNLVPPGLYLMKLTGNTDEGDVASTRVVSVVY